MPPVSRLRECSRRVNGSNTSARRSGGMPGPRSATSIATEPGDATSRTCAASPYLTAFSIRLRTARRISAGRRRTRMRSLSSSVTGSPRSRKSSTTASTSAARSTSVGGSDGRPSRASDRMSSSVRFMSVIVSIIRVRSVSSSTDSTRTRSAASGVRRSCPIAPSIRSFSSSIATTRRRNAL